MICSRDYIWNVEMLMAKWFSWVAISLPSHLLVALLSKDKIIWGPIFKSRFNRFHKGYTDNTFAWYFVDSFSFACWFLLNCTLPFWIITFKEIVLKFFTRIKGGWAFLNMLELLTKSNATLTNQMKTQTLWPTNWQTQN